jgi:ubiquinone/menaquinone biosynthesis C-methylase UbiE
MAVASLATPHKQGLYRRNPQIAKDFRAQSMSSAPAQKSAFLGGEGDKWFQRNASQIAQTAGDVVTEVIAALKLRPKAVFEIGAANGHRLATLSKAYGCTGSGLDPSSEAVKKGNALYPTLDLKVGTADELPFETGAFDIVIVGFCMYLIDPSLHFRAVAEADRILADGGAMVVFDFLPDQPYHNDYVHLAGLRAHKMEFSKLFTAHPAYSLVHRQLAQKSETFLQPDWREGVDVLIKNMAAAFPPNPRKR